MFETTFATGPNSSINYLGLELVEPIGSGDAEMIHLSA